MAKFNEIQAGRFNRFVQKLLGIKGGPPMPSVASDLFFTHQIFRGVETLYLEGWDDFFRQKAVTGTAALSTFELRNPAGSNVVAVVTRACILQGAATSDINTLFFVVGATADQGAVDTPRSFDTRGRPASTCVVSDNNALGLTAIGGTASPYIVRQQPTNGAQEYLQPGEEIVLLPGNAVYLQGTTNALLINPCFRWRERFLEDPERS